MSLPQARIWLLGMITLLVLAVAGCGAGPNAGQTVKADKPPAAVIANPTAVLQAASDKYLKLNRPLYIEPPEVLKAVVSGDQAYYFVDIRNDEHYAAAHIPGAVHIAYADVWREQKMVFLPRDKKIVVIDYSGHTASQTAALWGMLGFDAVAMKNGMAGWSKDREVIGGSPLLCEAFDLPVTTGPVAAAAYDPPKVETKAKTAAELVAARSQAATETAPVIQPKDFSGKLKSYYIVDLRESQHYQAGHIEGAVNIPFRGVAETENLRKLPSDKELVLVCYDGHAASQAARILNQLGYRAIALKDGMSAWVSAESIIGARPIACNVAENPVVRLNAPLQAGPSSAAT